MAQATVSLNLRNVDTIFQTICKCLGKLPEMGCDFNLAEWALASSYVTVEITNQINKSQKTPKKGIGA
jgi:hypothetical protein